MWVRLLVGLWMLLLGFVVLGFGCLRFSCLGLGVAVFMRLVVVSRMFVLVLDCVRFLIVLLFT